MTTVPPANRVWSLPPLVFVKAHREAWRNVAECGAVRLLTRAGVAVPRLLWSRHGPGQPFAVFRHVPGPQVHERDDAALRRVVSYLAAVHRIEGSAFGRVGTPGGFSGWDGYLRSRLDAYGRVFDRLGLADAAVATARLCALPTPPADRPRLVHNDPHPGNFLRARHGIVGTDWELAVFGDPLLDYGRMSWEWERQPDVFAHLLASVGVEADPGHLHYYTTLHVLGRLMGTVSSVRPDPALMRRCLEHLTPHRMGKTT